MHSVDWSPLTTCPKPASASGPAHPSASSPIPETHKNAPLSTCDWPVSVLSLSHSIQKDFLRRRERAHAAGGHVGLLTQSSRPASSTRPRRVLLTRGPTSRNAKASLLPFFFFLQAISRGANAFALSCGMPKCVFNLWLRVKFRGETVHVDS